jgi:hypothetical protein
MKGSGPLGSDEKKRGRENEPKVVHVIRRYIGALLARDWDALLDLFADSYCHDDRRTSRSA